MRVLLYAGKGGVGKTSLALATALAAAAHGHRVFVLSTDSAHSLGDALGRPVGPKPVLVAERVMAQEVAVLAELDRSWSELQDWLQGLFEERRDTLLAEELLVFPGLEELVALRAVRDVEAAGAYDVCVVDCAPTGSTLRMLRLPDVLRFFMNGFFQAERRAMRVVKPIADRIGAGRLVASDEVFAAFERLYGEVEDVRQILLDTDRTSARLVLNPARVVLEEARRSFSYLSLYGVATDAVLVNRVLPEQAARGYFSRWAERESRVLEEIASSFPLRRFYAPLLPREPIGTGALGALARELYGEEDPARLFGHARPIRFEKREERTVLEIDLPHAEKEEIGVTVCGDELLLRVRDARRRIALPASLAGRAVEGVRLAKGVLEVVFAP
ncbi:MAG: ArsA family ATPase [Deltaproteobacteria bacterium]|nr:ArsA family ATPase [Deltaproteobacteria bacterium]